MRAILVALAIALSASPVSAAAYPESTRPDTARIVLAPACDPNYPNRGTAEIYPAQSRECNEGGTVVLLLSVTETGGVSKAKVQVSSGFERLDRAAVEEALSAWRFLPGTISGRPTAMDMPIRLIFDPARPVVPAVCEAKQPGVRVL